MSGQYILDALGQPTPEPNLGKWAEWFGTADRIVARDTVGEAKVSTIFLGLDHSFGGSVPVLWETMIFGGPHDGYQDRYTSRADALDGHAKAVALAK